MSFIIRISMLALLVTLTSVIPVFSIEDDRDFKEVEDVVDNCPSSSRCVTTERCPHLYRTLNEGPDGTPMYISCNIIINIMGDSTLGICCNNDFLGQSISYAEEYPVHNLDLDTPDEKDFNTEDFTRQTRGTSPSEDYTETHSTFGVDQIHSHTSTPDGTHGAPHHGDSFDIHREGGEGLSRDTLEHFYRYDHPGNLNHAYYEYEENTCPLNCRGRQGIPGPMGLRGFPGPPGPPGPPGRVIYVNGPAPEAGSSQHSSSLSDISSFADGDDIETNNEDPNEHLQLNDYDGLQHNRRFGHYGRIGFRPLPYGMPLSSSSRPHVSKRYQRSVETPPANYLNQIDKTELQKLIAQLIKEYFDNN